LVFLNLNRRKFLEDFFCIDIWFNNVITHCLKQVTTGDHAGGVAIFMELHYPKIVLETCSLELQLKSLKGEGGFCTTPRWQVDEGPRDGAGPGAMAIEVARGAWQKHAMLFSCSSGRSCLCLSKSTS
jgi:hypothetical protein